MGRGTAVQDGIGTRTVRSWQQWLPIALVVGLFCVPLFVGLGRTDLGNDEAIYSFAVDKILETGDWLTPKTSPRIDIAFLEKPPLKFWIVALPISLGVLPHNEFGLRFWDALMGAAAFVLVYLLGRRLAGPICGIVAVMILFVQAALLFDHGLRSNNMEAPLLLAYCGGVYHYLRSAEIENPRRRAVHVYMLMLYFVLGFMTKFVAALLLVPIICAVALIRSDDRRRLWTDWRTWAGASAVAVLLIAPWFVYQWRQFGSAVWEIMLGAHVYTRFTGYLDPSHLQPWHYYVSTLYGELRDAQSRVLVLPGAALLVANAIRFRRRDELITVAWFLLPVVLISLGTSKLYHYIYPFLPPVALAGGYLAGYLLQAVPRFLRGPARKIDANMARLVDRRASWLGYRRVQVFLLALALFASVIAVVTLIRGGVHLKIGSTTILRNASSTRPLVYAVGFAALAGQMTRVARLAAPVLLLWLVPVEPYGMMMARTMVEKHPMRSARDCLLQLRGAGAPASGVYVDAPGERVHHFHHYYLEALGPFERSEPRSDAQLFARLYLPSKQKPVLVWEEQYQNLVSRLQHRDTALFDEIARAESISRETVEDIARHASSPMVPLNDVLLVLPGRFSACGR